MVIVPLLLSAGCNKLEVPTKGGPLTDTGWFVDTGLFDPATCPHRWATTEPLDGTTNWYHRDPVRVFTQTDKHDWYQVEWINGDGERIEHTVQWDTTGLSAELVPAEPIAAGQDYTLQLTDCGSYDEVSFSTSTLGMPLDGPITGLIGRTYYLDMDNATWIEPVGVEAILQIYFNTPLLIGVSYVDEDRIDLLGAPGETDIFGKVVQDTSQTTWAMPTADFTTKPFFSVTNGDIVLESDGFEVPVTEFALSGTFSADMSSLGGGTLSGLGDSRYLGGALGQPDNPEAICNFAGTLGVDCVDCPDGEPYCLFLHAVDIHGSHLPNVTLLPRN